MRHHGDGGVILALLFIGAAALAAETAHRTRVERRDIAILAVQAAVVLATAAAAIFFMAVMDL